MVGENKELTIGEKAVGIGFNPGGNPDVHKVKELYAEIIDLLHRLEEESTEAGRMVDHAIREAQTAQMWAVKVITWKK